MRRCPGFSLVEVLVTAGIVVILAAVAVPIYSGYIRDSRVKSAEHTAASVAGTCGALCSFSPDAVPDGVFRSAGGRLAVISVPGVNSSDADVIAVPDGYTVTISRSARTVICTWNKDPSVSSETRTF